MKDRTYLDRMILFCRFYTASMPRPTNRARSVCSVLGCPTASCEPPFAPMPANSIRIT